MLMKSLLNSSLSSALLIFEVHLINYPDCLTTKILLMSFLSTRFQDFKGQYGSYFSICIEQAIELHSVIPASSPE